MLSTKSIALAAAAALVSVVGATAATASASSDCAAGFCGRTVSTDLTPGQALADGASHRVISTSNETTGASLYDVKPANGANGGACPAAFGNVYKTFVWNPAGDAGASGLGFTVVNGTQLYDQPINLSSPKDTQVFCYNPADGAWAPRSGGEIRFNFNNTPVSVVSGDGTATQFVGVNH